MHKKIAGEVSMENIQLKYNSALSSDRIGVQYSVDNTTNKEIFLFDQQYKCVDSKVRVISELGYTLIDGSSIIFFHGIMTIPPFVQVEIPEIPYARKLMPGQGLSVSYELMYPIEFNNPYDWIENEEQILINKGALKLGYVVGDEFLTGKYKKINIDEEDLYVFNYQDVIKRQKYIISNYFEGCFSIVKRN